MWTLVDSPVGPVRIVAHPVAVTAVEFVGDAPADAAPRSSMRAAELRAAGREVGDRDDDAPLLAEAAAQLRGYFAGEVRDFDLPLDPGGTDFQRRVWTELRRIEYGRTSSYGELAARLGLHRGASRAVGAANGRNPIGIVVPCHRVVGVTGSLSGYAGGVERKRLLLRLEQDAIA
ncbi:MAG: methylated-DNA--[protein]-cysteine S-methyltransferase [Nocardioidaceae bacterium]